MVATLGQQYSVGERPTIVLYTYDCHTRGYFRALPSQNGDKYVTSPPTPIVELVRPPNTTKTKDDTVFVFSSHPFWTSSSLDVPAGVTQEEGHTGFLIHLPSAVRALIFVARRIQPFLSLVDREVEFCVLTN